ncbi:phage minor head protein [Sphingomonas crocodyli]|uniref:Phage head morphogenesis domain-containing protein n=1 Tax=Sphingomonas crocodyli TaxID=1979270 RepID=A0A437M844_9SPHN|nr:phage minor head protein [Sphingomonas crocodyli]RVT93705.1 hypothetical protein EOD43_07520 [Sphingomonas crocodyli]
MRYDLATLVRRSQNPRRKTIDIRPIAPPGMLAQALFARCYRPVVNAWTAALPRVLAEYERSIAVRDQLSGNSGQFTDSISSLSDLLDAIGKELSDLVLQLLPELREWAARVSDWHTGQWRGAVLSATNVDIEQVLLASGQPQSVAETIAWNVSLIKDVNAQAQQRIANAVFAAARGNVPTRDLARQLREIVGMSRTRSMNIASDQLTKFSSALDQERATDAGLETYTWMWSHKKHGRKEHIARDGDVFRYDKPPQDGPPGSLPFCGCRARARLELK